MSDFLKRYSKIRGADHVQSLQLEGQIAAQIKTKRQTLKMSQQKLADLAGVPKSTIGRIEAGLTSPKVETLLKISKALETPFIIDGTLDGGNNNLYVQT
ncbi:transcriptional regulator [Virgibacillus profundi]|uniref:Transcriptional regulator n=1 Tax=Virgibacillus profundi TaxID=2024555 RepID=A0A2A2IGH9_9BACI|nr:helix-turn-helix transcriptional regulator [Virgibacillus profundi]PAV30757.1 transcriptional regulator [Virgibacillus profundi]PXY54940.1 XRE family transcriptional regulator [Virgibacillus profundi]